MRRVVNALTRSRSESDEQRNERLRRFSGTVGWTLVFIWAFAAGHFFSFKTEYTKAMDKPWDSPFLGNYGEPIVLFVFSMVVILLLMIFSNERIRFFVTSPIPQRVYIAVVLGVFSGLCIAGICYYSGGTSDSPFTPLLVAYGFIAVIFADRPITRLFLGFGTVAPFVVLYNQPYDEILPVSMFHDPLGIGFATAGLILSIILSFFTYTYGRPGDQRNDVAGQKAVRM